MPRVAFDALCVLLRAVIGDEEALVLHVTLSPSEMGTLTMYVPVVMEGLGFDR